MSFLRPKKTKPPTTGRTEYMTGRMNNVIQAYVNRYNSSGYIQAKNSDVIRNIAIIVTPIMQGILQKYNEGDFHRVMNKQYYDEQGRLCYGFDFIGDIRRNHPYAFSIAMTVAKSYKKKLNFDANIATDLVIDIMHSWGWTVTYTEKMSMRHLLFRMKRLIHNA